MKKVSGLIIVIVALVLIYTGFWFYQAHHIKELVMYHLNEYKKPNAEGYAFAVDDVSIHGYPFNYEIKLTHPRYENISQDAEHHANFAIDKALKIGTDIFGRSYWVKQDGDIQYVLDSAENKKYTVKGNLNLTVDVAHPQYAQAFMHPFFGLPKAFYKENPTFQELLEELKMASYEDHNFGIYELKDDQEQQLLGFSKGWVRWKHNPIGNETEKFAFELDLKDFEAVENGKPLLPHLKKLMDLNTDMAVDIPYMLASGKNTLSLDLDVTLPQNIDPWKFFTYKNLDIDLKKFELNNQYGRTLASFDLNLTEKEKDERNLHLGLNTESLMTSKGSDAVHRQFIDSLRLKVKEDPKDPDNQVLADLLKCCEDKLQEIVPNYEKLGKVQFILDMDMRIKDALSNATLSKILVSHLDLFGKPYGIKSHGAAEFINDQPSGKYDINWINYKEMIHDVVDYYNHIHPLIVKFSEANKQPFLMGLIDEPKEKEIIDFFTSISNEPSANNSDITITFDFTDINNLKIGNNSLEQVKQAWDKLVADIVKTEKPEGTKPLEAPKPS